MLTNWYIRRSRERFWDTSGAAESVARQAFDTLYTALEVTCRATAPLLPLVTEEIWRGLTGERSVHLADWPDVSGLPADPGLVAAMDRTRDVCSAAASLRKAGGLRVRLPLPELTVVAPDAESLADFTGLIADEVNVREVTLLDAADAEAQRIGVVEAAHRERPAGRPAARRRTCRPRSGRASPATGPRPRLAWSPAAASSSPPDEFTVETVLADGAGPTAMLPGGGFIVLDTTVTPPLAAEGLARDVVRAVQQARRAAGLDVSDRISLVIAASAAAQDSMRAHQQLIAGETLATAVEFTGPAGLNGDPRAGDPVPVGDGESVRIRIIG